MEKDNDIGSGCLFTCPYCGSKLDFIKKLLEYGTTVPLKKVYVVAHIGWTGVEIFSVCLTKSKAEEEKLKVMKNVGDFYRGGIKIIEKSIIGE